LGLPVRTAERQNARMPFISRRSSAGAAQTRDRAEHRAALRSREERAMRAKETREAGEPVLSPMAQLKASVVELETERDLWKRRAEEAGSLFDLRRDTPESIARTLVEACAPSRAEKIAAAIRAELKRQRAARRLTGGRDPGPPSGQLG
jgi:hypothetical protein